MRYLPHVVLAIALAATGCSDEHKSSKSATPIPSVKPNKTNDNTQRDADNPRPEATPTPEVVTPWEQRPTYPLMTAGAEAKATSIRVNFFNGESKATFELPISFAIESYILDDFTVLDDGRIAALFLNKNGMNNKLVYLKDGALDHEVSYRNRARSGNRRPSKNCKIFPRPDGRLIRTCSYGVVEWLDAEGEVTEEWLSPWHDSENAHSHYRSMASVGPDGTVFVTEYPNKLNVVREGQLLTRTAFVEGHRYSDPTFAMVMESGTAVVGNHAQMRAHNNYNVVNFFEPTRNGYIEVGRRVLHIPMRMAIGTYEPSIVAPIQFVINDHVNIYWINSETREVVYRIDKLNCTPLAAMNSGVIGCVINNKLFWLKDGKQLHAFELQDTEDAYDPYSFYGTGALSRDGEYIIAARKQDYSRNYYTKLVWLQDGEKTFEYEIPQKNDSFVKVITMSDGTVVFGTRSFGLQYMKKP